MKDNAHQNLAIIFSPKSEARITITPKYDIKCFQHLLLKLLYYDVYMILFVRTRIDKNVYYIYIHIYILYRLIILENVFYNSLCVFLFTRVLQVISDIVIDKEDEKEI